MTDEHEIERGPARRTRSDGPKPLRRPVTAPLESLESAAAATPRVEPTRRRSDTSEMLPQAGFDGIVPLFDDIEFEADGPIERTLGFDEALSTLDEEDQAALKRAVARSLEAEQAALVGEDASSTVDFDADTARAYAGVSPDETIDFALGGPDSMDSLDQAIDAAPLEDNPTDVDFPRSDTRPLGGMDPPEWAAHVIKACRTLGEIHEDGRTFDGHFDLDETGVKGQARRADAGSDSLIVDLRRMHHLIGVIAEAVRAGSDHSPTSLVVADALAELKPAESAAALGRDLMRALGARTTRQHRRMEAEFEAVDARRRALATQRRLRADLAARLARLDASISAQAAAVARDEDRVNLLNTERKALDELMALVGAEPSSGPRSLEGAGSSVDEPARDADEDRSDAVRRLLGA